MAGLLSNGIFGGGGAGQMSLLGDFYNPDEMRRRKMKQGLLAAGAAMMSQQPAPYPINFMSSLGAGLGAGVKAAGEAEQDYRQSAIDMYGINRMAENDAYGRERDQVSDQHWRQDFDYGKQKDARDYALRKQQLAQLRQSAKEYGLNPVWLQNPQTGKFMLVQPSKAGGYRPMDMPQGFEPAPPNRSLDTGTGYQTVPSRGVPMQMGGTIPIDNTGKARQTAVGKGQGEVTNEYNDLNSKMPSLEQVVSDLDGLAEKATYTMGGRLWDAGRREIGAEPRESAIARAEYVAKVDNQILPLLRVTFGAQFTVKEGETLRATLGDPNKAPQEKQAVLRAFIEQKRRDVAALGAQAGQAQPIPQGQPTNLKSKYGLE